MLKLQTITYPDSAFSANTYLLINDDKRVIVVDPGQTGHGLLNFLHERNYVVAAIFLTHTHFDHIRGVNLLVEAFDCPIYVHPLDVALLENPRFYRSMPIGKIEFNPKNVVFINDNQEIEVLGELFTVLHTPFHTPGSVFFIYPALDIAFTGDTVFARSIGRTDLFGSDERQIGPTLKKVMDLSPLLMFYPGHGSKTRLADEIKFNRFFMYYK